MDATTLPPHTENPNVWIKMNWVTPVRGGRPAGGSGGAQHALQQAAQLGRVQAGLRLCGLQQPQHLLMHLQVRFPSGSSVNQNPSYDIAHQWLWLCQL